MMYLQVKFSAFLAISQLLNFVKSQDFQRLIFAIFKNGPAVNVLATEYETWESAKNYPDQF